MKINNNDNAAVVILEADGEVSNGNGYGYAIGKRLEELGYSFTVTELASEVMQIDKLPDIPLIISGGMTEVTSDIDWIVKARTLVKQRIEANQSKEVAGERIPLLGICFGAQLIAESYASGSVMYLDEPQMGANGIELLQEGKDHPLFNGYDPFFKAYSFHYNQIKPDHLTSLSRKAVNSGEFVQAFGIEDAAAYGVQFHPELNYEDYLPLIATYEELLQKELGLSPEQIKEEFEEIPSNKAILNNFMMMCSR